MNQSDIYNELRQINRKLIELDNKLNNLTNQSSEFILWGKIRVKKDIIKELRKGTGKAQNFGYIDLYEPYITKVGKEIFSLPINSEEEYLKIEQQLGV